MPLPLVWTEAADCRLKRLRAEGATWNQIAADMGLNRGSLIARGMRIGARAPALDREAESGWSDPLRLPLPAGHPVAWGALVTGTLLDGMPFKYEPAGSGGTEARAPRRAA